MYETWIFYMLSFFRWIINLLTLPNFVTLTALFTYPFKLAGIRNYCIGYCWVKLKSTFSLLMYSLIWFGKVFSFFAMTHTDRTFTWLVKGTISNNYPSQSEVTDFVLSYLYSNVLKTAFPDPALYSFKHRILSTSMTPNRSFEFSAPTYSTHPQFGPWTCCI